jgi:hypothetical protein
MILNFSVYLVKYKDYYAEKKVEGLGLYIFPSLYGSLISMI